MTRHIASSLSAFLLLFATLVGCHKEEAKPGEKERPPVPVKTAKAEKRALRPALEVIGMVLVEPERAAALTAATPGLVERLAVPEGALPPNVSLEPIL